MKIKPTLLSLFLIFPLICAAENLIPEVLSVSILDNEDSEECPVSGPIAAFIEYDLKDDRYASLLIQVMSGNDVIYDTSITLHNNDNTFTVELPYIDCATDVITSFN
ncbi:conserved hypothetical protein [Alteromonas sp. 38]|uniref:hypothetical protein n=1 Tax=Alteromonas TaxID=226 RepID=UPI0012F24347|nr:MULTISPECIES: hypothetical protein [Alteromonas]CAD5287915.1 conserved hypothetical protein [Alteromonas sp. 154]VXB27991.1 conserved hypothetical protein [Alteromonas sp. 38]